MIKKINIIRYVTAIVLPLLLMFHPIAGICVSFGVLWLNNYVDDILFYIGSLTVKTRSANPSVTLSPVEGIVTKIEYGVPIKTILKKDVFSADEPLIIDLCRSMIGKSGMYDHIAIYLNKFSKHVVLHPGKMVRMYKHYSDGNIEMVMPDELVSDNVGKYMGNDALIIEYADSYMFLTMDKYISEYIVCNDDDGVCCLICRGSQCDMYFKNATFMKRVGDCIDIYDTLALAKTDRQHYLVERQIEASVSVAIKNAGGFLGMLLSSLEKTVSTLDSILMSMLVVFVPILGHLITTSSLFTYVGFSSIYLFLFVRSYRHLMYSLMNVVGLKEWMKKSYKTISKVSLLWKI